MGDSLSEMLANIQVTRFLCRRIQLGAPWGIKVGPSEQVRYCTVFSGEVHVEIPSTGHSYLLRAGDTIMLPHGAGHVMRDDPRSAVTMIAGDEQEEGGYTSTPTIHRHGGGGDVTDIVIGGYNLDRIRARPLMRFLPPEMLIEGEGDIPEWRVALMAMRRKELQDFSAGSAAVLRHMATTRFAQIVRHFVSVHMKGAEVLSGDLAVGAAVFAMHDRPQEQWTVADLARLAGMSRSGFAAAFTTLLGESPMRYLYSVRMARAAELLGTNDIPLSDAAMEAGYSTSIAFMRAFKRHFGTTPGEYRRWKGREREAASVGNAAATAPFPPISGGSEHRASSLQATRRPRLRCRTSSESPRSSHNSR